MQLTEDGVVTLDELAEYNKLCIEQDLAGNGNTPRACVDPEYMTELFMLFSGTNYDTFKREKTDMNGALVRKCTELYQVSK